MSDPITDIFKLVLDAQFKRDAYNARMSGIAWLMMACKTVRVDIEDEENGEAFTQNMVSAFLAIGITPDELDIVMDALPSIEEKLIREGEENGND